MKKELRYDEIGNWSEIKLEIIKEYAAAYSVILSKQTQHKLEHIYIDAFAGAGKHVSKTSGEFVPGSPDNALRVKPPFHEYHFIDLEERKVVALEELAGSREDVFVYHGDCNKVLLEKILPTVRYEKRRRALCLLDPYGLHLDWTILCTMGEMGTIDMFLNFPIADINRNVLRRNHPEAVPQAQKERLNKFWGDDSWETVAYTVSTQGDLFDDPDQEKATNDQIAEAFRGRLQKEAGFKYVPKPIAMRNTQNAIVYYLFFASQNQAGQKIAQHIFTKYENRMGA